jgi:glycosyltransferase involved in cell wall biosynthesis
MDILFLGGVFPKDEENLIYSKSKGNVQFAANVLQWNIIKGLDICNGFPITILNSIFIGSYPKYYQNIYVKSRIWSHTKDADDRNVGFLNLFGIKQIWRGFNISKQIKKWAVNKKQEKKTIIIYSMNTPFIYAAVKAKRINPNIHICLMCPDLPGFMNLRDNRSFFLKTLKTVDRVIIDYYLQWIDSFIFLTKYMAERINVGNRPWIVIEGVVNSKELKIKQKSNVKRDDKKVILYTGTLNKVYGILELLKAFKLIEDPSIYLWICGAGEAQLEVEKYANINSRVKYFGQVTRDCAVKLQHEADLLINPRNSEGEYTKYSFPSKIMEYMISGTPTLIYRLPGIPDEYYDFLFTIEGDSPEDIASRICQIFNYSTEELLEFGAKAQTFVISKKNNIIQAQRIIDLINGEREIK